MPTEIEKRRHALMYYVQEVLTEYAVWADGTDSVILPDEPFDAALRNMFYVFENGDVPADLRGITREVEKLQADYQAYQQRMEDAGQWSELPPTTVGVAIANIKGQFFEVQQPPKPALETIADFDRQKVSDRQIAVAYEWYLPNGQPDEARVRKQRLEDANLIIENPHNAALEERKQRDQAAIEAAIEKQRAREEAANKPAPESIEELLEQGVGANQIAEMKRMTVGELERYCFEHALDLPGTSSIESAAAEVAQQEHEERQELLAPTPEPEDLQDEQPQPVSELSLEEQIVATAQEDPEMPHGDIAEMLDTSVERVEAVLSRQSEVSA